MRSTTKYVLKVWFTSAIIGSTLFYWSTYFFNHDVITHGGQAGDRLAIYLLTLMFSLVLSIPALILLGLSIYALLETRLAFKTIRLLLSLIAVLLCALTFGLFAEFSYGSKDLILIPCYALPLVAGVFSYQLK